MIPQRMSPCSGEIVASSNSHSCWNHSDQEIAHDQRWLVEPLDHHLEQVLQPTRFWCMMEMTTEIIIHQIVVHIGG